MATEYGKRLIDAMAFAKLNQKMLVAKTGIRQSSVSSTINRSSGSSDTPVYAVACGVDAHWLATGQGDMVPKAAPNSVSDEPHKGISQELQLLVDILMDVKSDQIRKAVIRACLQLALDAAKESAYPPNGGTSEAENQETPVVSRQPSPLQQHSLTIARTGRV